MKQPCHKLFVYGSLKMGYHLHSTIQHCHFLGTVTTEPNYRLYSLGSFPALVQTQPGQGTAVKGELYGVSAEHLNYLDIVEGVKRGMYKRHPLKVIDSDGDVNDAVTYLWRLGVGNCKLIPEGVW